MDEYPDNLCVYECLGPRLPHREPDFEGFLGVWPEPPFYYIFFDRPVLPQLRQWLQDQIDWELKDFYQLKYHQWQQISQQKQKIGPFVIHTDVSSACYMKEGVSICIRPGLTFGSGVHSSSRGCLLSIAKIYERHLLSNVVDLGTGTGILSLACARLGARRILALDCNSLAVRETRKNVQVNQLETRVYPLVADTLNVVKTKADLLLMNLEWPCLQQILQEKEWRKFPRVILSGFLDSQEDRLKSLLPRDYSIVSRIAQGHWVTLTLHHQ